MLCPWPRTHNLKTWEATGLEDQFQSQPEQLIETLSQKEENKQTNKGTELYLGGGVFVYNFPHPDFNPSTEKKKEDCFLFQSASLS